MSEFRFKKSSYSEPNGECVEVARNVPRTVAVRDSKDPSGSVLTVSPSPGALSRQRCCGTAPEKAHASEWLPLREVPSQQWRRRVRRGGPQHPRTVAVRDSKRPGGPVVTVAPDAWGAFTADLRQRQP